MTAQAVLNTTKESEMDVSPKLRHRVGAKPHTKLALSMLVWIGTMTALPSWAAVVTTNELGMDAIFSAPVFGSETVDIRFNSVVNHIDGTLLNIAADLPGVRSSPADPNNAYNKLRSFYAGLYPANIVRMFFIDAIHWCGSNGIYAGCAESGGNDIFLDSDFADNSYGDVLNAHELGHNLGLDHNESTNNLMKSTVTNDSHTVLLSSQVDIILASPLVQTDALGNFITIVPILVSATAVAVPIPSALVLCFSALGTIGLFGRSRRRRQAV